MKTILITGVARGIGFQLVNDYLQLDYHVIGTCRKESDFAALEQNAECIGSGKLSLFKADVTSDESINSLALTLKDQPIDILINNAGVIGGDHQTSSDFNFADWSYTHEVNTIAPMRVALAFAPNLKLTEQPKLITISSLMGSLAREVTNSIAYRSSKAAVNKAMQCLSIDLRPDNIVVCPVHPGWVRTDMGGPNADISVEECTAGLVKLIEGLTLKESGRFWQYNGEELAF